MSRLHKVIALCSAVLVGVSAGYAQNGTKIVLDGSTTVGPIAKAFAEYYMGKHPEVNITVSESGSGSPTAMLCVPLSDGIATWEYAVPPPNE